MVSRKDKWGARFRCYGDPAKCDVMYCSYRTSEVPTAIYEMTSIHNTIVVGSFAVRRYILYSKVKSRCNY